MMPTTTISTLPSHCTTCGDRLPQYYAVLMLHVCLLCRVLSRYQQGGTHYGPWIALQQRKALAHQRVVPTPVPASTDEDALVIRVVAWATAHNNEWPHVTDFRRSQGLPSLRLVRERWGSVVEMRGALHDTYPQFHGRYVLRWTCASICQAFTAWIARHPGAIPLTHDCQMDDTLPPASVVHEYFQGLRSFYAVFEAGKYAQQFEQTVVMRRLAASAKGHAEQRARRANRDIGGNNGRS